MSSHLKELGCLLLAIAVGGGCGRQSTSPEAAAAGSTAPPQPSTRELPKDVYPESHNRLPIFQVDNLDEAGKKVLSSFEGGAEAAASSGPRSIRMYSPQVAEYMTRGNQYLRYESGLDPKLRELAILLAARATDQQYEWTAHEETARKVGLSEEVINIVKHGRPITGIADEKEAVLIKMGREALYDHRVRSDTFASALELFGKKGLVDVVSLIGHYTATGILLTVFDQQLQPGQEPALVPLGKEPRQ